jgi:hypothetical protein
MSMILGNNLEYQNIPICFEYNQLFYSKKNKHEKYIIFSSAFQLQRLKKCSQIYIDATYKSCPKSFYQLLNIAGYIPEINHLIPLFMIPMSSKNEYLYNKVFKNIISVLGGDGISLKDITNKFMCDFEPALFNSIKFNFKDVLIDGCYFHYIKLGTTPKREFM